ncbi:proton-conducting transporter membrane subunit [Roseomonas sp. 18066]|uniref:proton-conducting transporter transmembrane domain-containing protein n=1 Tax=Roseomonas sp. 18066 TaxID=2681412 RepID=UPI00135B51C3|nr:proton-conducting transporter membrane subunit [Roseomonas sp. 18066]
MTYAPLVILHLLAALALAFVPRPRWAGFGNLGVAALALASALALAAAPQEVDGFLHLDALNLWLVPLAALVGLSAAAASLAILPAERLGPRASRAYFAAFQLFLGAVQLALLADNMVVLWAALQAAVMAAVLLAALRRGPAAVAAAWKLLILGGVGIALALFGTILLGLAAQPYAGGSEVSLSFNALLRVGREADGGLLTLAFVFLLVGYGSIAALVPLQGWLADATAEAPAAVPALLNTLLLVAALHAILRARAVVALNPEVVAPGTLMMALGLATLLLAGLSLWRRRDAGRWLAWIGIAQSGLAAFAFGLGGPAAIAGILLLLGQGLLLGALALALAEARLMRGAQQLSALAGLSASRPWLGAGVALALLGLAGLPPFSPFAAFFLLMQQVAARLPWLAIPLVLGLLLVALALVARLQALCFGPPGAAAAAPALAGDLPARWAIGLPLALHLALALALGLFLPPALRDALAAAARIVQ